MKTKDTDLQVIAACKAVGNLAAKYEDARALLRQCEIVLSMVPTREPVPGWMKSFVNEYVTPLVKRLR